VVFVPTLHGRDTTCPVLGVSPMFWLTKRRSSPRTLTGHAATLPERVANTTPSQTRWNFKTLRKQLVKEDWWEWEDPRIMNFKPKETNSGLKEVLPSWLIKRIVLTIWLSEPCWVHLPLMHVDHILNSMRKLPLNKNSWNAWWWWVEVLTRSLVDKSQMIVRWQWVSWQHLPMIKVMLLLMLKRKFSTLRLLQVNTTSGLIQIHLILEKPLREQFQDWKWVQ